MAFEQLYFYKKQKQVKKPLSLHADVIIYGATPAGITAALQIKKQGYDVIIVEFGRFIGGMTTSGLGATDLGAEMAVGGYAKKFYNEVAEHYGKVKLFQFEPKVATAIFTKWLEEASISVYLEQHLQSIEKVGARIVNLTMENGNLFVGKVFLDCSYEGDLLAKAGVTYKVGRESNSTYKEIYNGIQFGAPHHKFERWIDPYVVEGDPMSGLLPGIVEEEIGFQGQGDDRIQAYNFRICLTKNEEKVPFSKPNNYDRARYALLARYISNGHWDAMKLHIAVPNGKTDLNNFGAFSTDNIGKNYDWPEGSYERREEIYQDHLTYDLGLLYFLAYDDSIPQAIRNEVSAWGLPTDEFSDTHHWPPQLYIREARRMISDYVMTDGNALRQKQVDDPIGLASFHMDSHNVRRVVIDGRVCNEGDVQVPVAPFPISYRAIRPKKDQCENLLVPVCLSSSHICYGSIRMEPVFMILGQSAGEAAVHALKNHCAVQDVPYNELATSLIAHNQVISWTDDMKDDPIARMKATFGDA